jgi:hypothetical protein
VADIAEGGGVEKICPPFLGTVAVDSGVLIAPALIMAHIRSLFSASHYW